MYESPEELRTLQQLLDRSAAAAGPHLRSVIPDDHRLSAEEVCQRLQGMCLLTVCTVTADGRPVSGAVDGYLLHGSFWFSSSPEGVRMRHLAERPAVSATYLPGEKLAVTVHGTAELLTWSDPAVSLLRQAMLDHYLPIRGPSAKEWIDSVDAVAARITAQKMFTFHMFE